MIRVLIYSNIRIYREGIAEVLGHRPGIEVIGTASSGERCIAEARRLEPSVILLDMATTGGAAELRRLAEAAPEARTVALGVAETEENVVAYAEAGVAGYVTRDQTIDELVSALASVARGEMLCSPRTAAMLLRRVNALAAARPRGQPAAAASLTAREREILALIADGLSNKQIGQRLCVQVPTVKNHVHHILEKLGVARRGEAVALARELMLP